MKLTRTFLTLTLAAGMTAAAPAANATSTDSSFVQTAQQDLLGQYALAAVAKNKAQNPDLKSIASQIASNMGEANNFIKTYASSHGVSVANKPAIRADAQYGAISSLTGKDFDKQYAQDLNVDAQLQVSDFEDEAANGTDPILKAFAKKEAALLKQASAVAQKVQQ